MKRTKNGYTRKQYAYAQNNLSGKGKSKKEIALMSGYSLNAANSVKVKIENTEGYSNAMAALAGETGNFALQVYHALKQKDLSKESVSTLLGAVSTLASAWEKFTPKAKEDEGHNRLKGVILQHVTTQNINTTRKDD